MAHETPAPVPSGDAAGPRLAYRVNEAAAAVGLGRTSIYELIKTGRLRTIKVAGRRLIPAESLRALIADAASDAG